MMVRLAQGSWYCSLDHGQLGQVIETQALWDETICRVWLPISDSVVRIPVSGLRPLESAGNGFKRAWQELDYDAIIVAVHRIPEDVLQEDPTLLMGYNQAVTHSGESA